ncbi:DUF4249 domain-containing protein [Pedobacter sp. KBW06]|uniref:DUF4249 domain-containing protein n=1 Tax=Pedobacter sp. KBW06 TaxID=2153359 RepID=UPI00131538AC|nr:DUF4249 domain-containing protein [Pedobacter sp. KBW06]
MLNQIKYISLLLAGSFTFASCEKVIEVKLDNAESQVVIEGNITDQAGQQLVKITKSVPYTATNTYPPVSGAVVTVTDDNGHSWTFSETTAGRYTFPAMKGETGRIYTLKARINNVVYTASSVMPAPVGIDFLDVKVFNFGGDDQKQAQVHYKDPAGIANQYRFVMKVNGIQSKQVYAENDRLTDGNEVPSVLFFTGNNNDQDQLKTGDVVDIEMQSIDKNVFLYWYTLSQQSSNGPAGGATPGNPPSNIDNKALGYFSAHTVSQKQMTVK